MYGTAKNILAQSFTVPLWWEREHWKDALKAFGWGALDRGVKYDKRNGVDVPQEAIDFLEENKPLQRG